MPLYLHATVWDLFFVYKHFVEKGEEISAIEQKRITEVLILSNLASIHQIEGTKRPVWRSWEMESERVFLVEEEKKQGCIIEPP